MCANSQNFVQIIILMVSIFLKEADVSNMGGGVCLYACLAPVNE